MPLFSGKSINRFPVPFDTSLSVEYIQQLKHDLPYLGAVCSDCGEIYQFYGYSNNESIMTPEQLFDHYAQFVNLSWLDAKYDTDLCRFYCDANIILCPSCYREYK